jgi:hypothetical protein
MNLNFFSARKRAASEINAVELTGNEVLHPVIADLMIAEQKKSDLSSHDRDYGASRPTFQMPVAFV